MKLRERRFELCMRISITVMGIAISCAIAAVIMMIQGYTNHMDSAFAEALEATQAALWACGLSLVLGWAAVIGTRKPRRRS